MRYRDDADYPINRLEPRRPQIDTAVERCQQDNSATEPRVATYELLVHLSLQQVGALRKLIHSPGVEVLAEEYEEQATFRLRVEADRIEALREELAALRAQAPNF